MLTAAAAVVVVFYELQSDHGVHRAIPAAFFTAMAVTAALYHVVSGLFAAPYPPRPREELEAEPLPPPVQLGEVSEEELRQYNGSDPIAPPDGHQGSDL
ncbi:hypothetical protein GUJ93_ZPchr0010g8142 [Zizania palustris]|uniref:Uncharacterized protein n=1 Tax=Zizania palustris TaxID=103762 RepID=A0A8J5W7A4_ZIZPA|nr:hypothetical protein GUJ93_ZPchr0010g8142 [Zizania palustris]